MNKLQLMMAGSVLLALGACGGGGSSETLPPTPVDEVPTAASASVQGMGDFLVNMTATTSETKDPLALTRFEPKVSDDSEPRQLR
jgi:hypothetical protein